MINSFLSFQTSFPWATFRAGSSCFFDDQFQYFNEYFYVSLSSEQEARLPAATDLCQGGGGDLLREHEHLRHHRHRLCLHVLHHGGRKLFPLPLQGTILLYYIFILINHLYSIVICICIYIRSHFSSIPGSRFSGRKPLLLM